MKEYIFKSKIAGLIGCFLMVLCVSCSEDSFKTYPSGGFQVVTDPFLQIQTPVVSFQAGTPDYTIEFNAVNGSKAIATVNAYSTFTDASSGLSSDQVLLASYTVTTTTAEAFTSTFTYADLSAGVTVNGSALPASDVDLAVGSGWRVHFEAVQPDGTILPLAGSINIAVLSRFAGIYRILDMVYWRIGVDRDDVYASEIGNTRFIGSVDENTFSYNDYWGPFQWTGSQFNFDIDFTDNTITVPIIVAGLFSGNRATNCIDDLDVLTNIPCATSNILEPNDVTGAHRITLAYGYFTDGSGAREFWEVLEKVVD